MLTCLLVVSACVPAVAGNRARTIKGKYYIVRGTLEKDDLKDYARYMDNLGKVYYDLFKDMGGRVTERFSVHIWQTREEYLRDVGAELAHSGGVFIASKNLLATYVQGRPRWSVREVLRHEGQHQFFHAFIGGDRPIWINEGLATYFESSMLAGDKMVMGGVSLIHLLRLKLAVKAGKLPSLEDVMTVSHRGWHDNMRQGNLMGQLQYPAVWSLVHYLRHGAGAGGRKALDRYLRELNRRNDPERAIVRAFGKGRDLQKLEQGWHEYIKTIEPPDIYATHINLGHIFKALVPAIRGKHDFTAYDSAEALFEAVAAGKVPGADKIDPEWLTTPGARRKDDEPPYHLGFEKINDYSYPVLACHHYREATVRFVYEKVDDKVQLSVQIVEKETPPRPDRRR